MLCNEKINVRIKGTIYKLVVRPVILYEQNLGVIKVTGRKTNVAEMRMMGQCSKMEIIRNKKLEERLKLLNFLRKFKNGITGNRHVL